MSPRHHRESNLYSCDWYFPRFVLFFVVHSDGTSCRRRQSVRSGGLTKPMTTKSSRGRSVPAPSARFVAINKSFAQHSSLVHS